MAINENKYLTTSDLANELELSPRTIERWRIEGKGPKFYKFGSKVLYPVKEVAKWIEQQLQTSTSV